MHGLIATLVQTLNEAVCISSNANVLGKGICPSVLLPSYGQIVGQTVFFSFGLANSLGERKLWIQTSFNPLQNWPCIKSSVWGFQLDLTIMMCVKSFFLFLSSLKQWTITILFLKSHLRSISFLSPTLPTNKIWNCFGYCHKY